MERVRQVDLKTKSGGPAKTTGQTLFFSSQLLAVLVAKKRSNDVPEALRSAKAGSFDSAFFVEEFKR